MKNRLMTPAKAAAAVSLAFMTAVAATSCMRDPIIYPTANYYQAIELSGNVRNAPAEQDLPKIWTSSYYEQSSCSYSMYLTPAQHPADMPYGGYITGLEAGRKTGLVYNYDAGGVHFDATNSLDRVYAYTDVLNYSNGTPIIAAPSSIYAWCEELGIPFITKDDNVHVIKAVVEEVTQTWNVRVVGIEGIQNVESVSFYLSGQRRGCFLGNGGPFNERAIIFFGGSVVPVSDGEAGGQEVRATYSTFGFFPEMEKALITVQINAKSTFTYYLQEDVTDIVSDPEAADYTIVIDGSSIEVTERKDGGFNPEAKEWDPEVTQIILE